MRAAQVFFTLLLSITLHNQVWAWGHDGHESVGAIADRLIAKTNASTAVKKILGRETLQQAAVWADCAKGINPAHDFAYEPRFHTTVCRVYESPAGQQALADYVRRNDTNCTREEATVSCHKEYHYADVAIQQDGYKEGLVGTDDHDIVHAINAAIRVLKGQPAPAPFNIQDKREALRLLAHFVGDIHQPLHVGAVYLDNQGNVVDPDVSAYDPATKTNGGNSILINNVPLHAKWDAVPTDLQVAHVVTLAKLAKRVAPTPGAIFSWPDEWATESVGVAQLAYEEIDFTAEDEARKEWPASFIDTARYAKTMNAIKQQQIAAAGARLAQILKKIWP